MEGQENCCGFFLFKICGGFQAVLRGGGGVSMFELLFQKENLFLLNPVIGMKLLSYI